MSKSCVKKIYSEDIDLRQKKIKNNPTALFVYSKTTEGQITKNKCSNTSKIQFI